MLRKIVADNQKDWHEQLHEALWSYTTSVKLSTGVTLQLPSLTRFTVTMSLSV